MAHWVPDFRTQGGLKWTGSPLPGAKSPARKKGLPGIPHRPASRRDIWNCAVCGSSYPWRNRGGTSGERLAPNGCLVGLSRRHSHGDDRLDMVAVYGACLDARRLAPTALVRRRMIRQPPFWRLFGFGRKFGTGVNRFADAPGRTLASHKLRHKIRAAATEVW
jgi:hypothetical protein